MTERKKLPEQRATYSFNKLEKIYDPRRNVPVRNVPVKEPGRKRIAAAPRSLGRVVTVPKADPSAAWQTFEQRRTRIQRVRARPQKPVTLVPRTLVQTGVRANSGRIHAVRRPLPYKSSVPLRSGRQHLRRSVFWTVVVLLLILACVLALANFVLTNSMFRVQRVNVVGTHNAVLLQSIQHMDIQGQNIFLVNTEKAHARIQASPLVASVELSKQFPDQLIVTIVERKPVVLWQTAQGTFSVDSQGMVIASVSDTSSVASVGTVIDATPTAITPPSVNKTEPLLRPGTYLKNIDILFASDAWQHIPKVAGVDMFKLYYNGTMYASATSQNDGAAGSRGSYIIESPAGWKAYLGGSKDANSLDNRLKELREIVKLAHQQQMNIATIDLRYGLRPVFTLQ